MNKNQMSEAADQATNLLKALSGRSRLMILCQLVDGEQAVSELADALEMRQAKKHWRCEAALHECMQRLGSV